MKKVMDKPGMWTSSAMASVCGTSVVAGSTLLGSSEVSCPLPLLDLGGPIRRINSSYNEKDVGYHYGIPGEANMGKKVKNGDCNTARGKCIITNILQILKSLYCLL